MYDAAHGVVPTHEIFHKPFEVQIEYEEVDTPEGYRQWPGGNKLGVTIKVWKVQNKKFPEIDPGLVSDPYGFGDSPDAESISSGLNSKSPESVALGRHGNYFLWGFSAQPSDMTAEARNCFLNAVCYIRKFDGAKPLEQKTSQGREWVLLYGSPNGHDRNYYEQNLEYVYRGSNGFEVDEDAQALGISNRNLELLDKCVAMLADDDQSKLAMRILKRYTTERFSRVEDWRAWLETNRKRMFFTDVGGYKFMIAPEAPKSVAAGP